MNYSEISGESVKKNSNIQNHGCNFCSEIFSSQIDLEGHITEEHPDNEISPEPFERTSDIEIGESLNFTEESLNEKIDSNENIGEVIRDITEANLIISCKCCNEIFSCSTSLKNHQEKHGHHNKIHICEACGLEFGKESLLLCHQLITHKSQILECQCCPENFFNNS